MKRYADDYETVVTTDEKGNEKKSVVYHGDYFELSIDESGIIHFRRIAFLHLFAILLLHLISGFINNQGMNQFYVGFPYVLAFFPLLYLAAGIMRLPRVKKKYRREEVGLSFERMKTASVVFALLLGVGLIGEVVFILFFSAKGAVMTEYWYLFVEVLVFSATYLLIRLQRRILIQASSIQI